MTHSETNTASFPVIIWTNRRTGGTNLARALFSHMEASTTLMEPFNRPRLFGYVTQNWEKKQNLTALTTELHQILSKRTRIKHVLENVPMKLNEVLLDLSRAYGYRHLFLYRENAADRLLSLHYAEKTNVWHPESVSDTPVEAGVFSEEIPIKDLMRHERLCRRRLLHIYNRLVEQGGTPLAVSFEQLYSNVPSVSRSHLQNLFTELLQVTPPLKQIDAILHQGHQGTRSTYSRFPNAEKLIERASELPPYFLHPKPTHHITYTRATDTETVTPQLHPSIYRDHVHLLLIENNSSASAEAPEYVVKPSHGSPQTGKRMEGEKGERPDSVLFTCRNGRGRITVSQHSRKGNLALFKIRLGNPTQQKQVAPEPSPYKVRRYMDTCYLAMNALLNRVKHLSSPTPPTSEDPAENLPLKGTVLPRTGIGYFPIPKNACTSIKFMLYEAEYRKEFDRKAHDVHIHKFFEQKDRVHPIQEGTFRFIVLRDPIKRFLSGYSNRVLFHQELTQQHLQEKHPLMEFRFRIYTPDLNEFLSDLESYWDVPTIRHHLNPVSHSLTKEDLKIFSHIYPFEKLRELKQDIGDFLHQEINMGHMQTGGRKIPLRELSEEQMDFLIHFYRGDYDLMSAYYSPDKIWAEWRASCEQTEQTSDSRNPQPAAS